MGIILWNIGFSLKSTFPLICGNKVPPEAQDRSFFQQLESVDVSEYDTRLVRDPKGTRKTRVENGVIHAKSHTTISYNGENYPLHGSVRNASEYLEWHAYPHITVGVHLTKVYNPWWVYSGGWIAGTYVQPSFFFIVEKPDPALPAQCSRIAWGSVDLALSELPDEGRDMALWKGRGGWFSSPGITETVMGKWADTIGQWHYHAEYGYHGTELEDWEIYSPETSYLTTALDVFRDYMFRQVDSAMSGLEYHSVDPTFAWLLMENGFPDGYGSINYVESEHYRRMMEQHAYLDALSSVQHAWDNGVTNVTEFVKFFVNLFVHHKVEIPKNWKDGWLSYRYVYGTTKLDQEELAKDVLNGLNKVLSEGQRYVKVRGNYSMDIAGSHIKCTCEVYLKNKVYDFLDNCRIALERFGLIPDLYLVWDMTPYSFVIDWFLPIGNTLNAVDASHNFDGDNCIYYIGPVTFSFKYSRNVEGADVSLYSRRVTTKPVIQAFYWFVEPSSSSVKTWGKRIIDSLALFT